MEPARVVIVGAGLAGLRTAERLRRSGYDGRLTMLGAEAHLPYDRPPLSKALLATSEEPQLPVLRTADRLAELDLDLRLGVRATGLDADARAVHTDDGGRVPYDHLVIATGLTARTLPGRHGTDRPAGVAGVHTLRTFEDCLRLRTAAAGARHATVIGAGVLGSEIAATLRARGLDVALVDALPQPLCRVVGEEVGATVADLHRLHAVDLHLGSSVTDLRLGDAGSVDAVALADGTRWSTDLVVAAVGGAPDTRWLAGSGLAIGDGVVVDRHGAASLPRIWAVGDAAAVPDPRGAGHVRLEHWTSAGDLATTVATNVVAALAGRSLRAHDEVSYMWSDQYGVKFQCLGFPRPGDEVVVLTGSLVERSFLAAHVAGGRVHAVSGAGLPAALMRCRTAVANAVRLDELRSAAPWERKKVSA